MADSQQPSSVQTNPPKDGEISLEDIDRLLESEDPEFTKSLEEVRAVESDKDIVIDASAIDETMTGEGDGDVEGATDPQEEKRIVRWRNKVRLKIVDTRLRISSFFSSATTNLVIFLKTRPKEFALFLFVNGKVLAKKAIVPIKAFQDATRIQKITSLGLLALSAACVWILLANFKGVWLPKLSEPMLSNLEDVADSVETFRPEDEGESFYSAFPQERFEYLFKKMKVNLRRTENNANPMGAFEVIVLLDSKDTAIEVNDREVEFFDMLQRVFEEESVVDLETELGKNRLKSRLKRELNQKLTQGWAKEINFKTFILKP